MTVGLISACKNNNNEKKMTQEFESFMRKFDSAYHPLSIQSNLAYWNASISGKEKDFDKVEKLSNTISNLLSKKEDFEILKKVKESKSLKDDILKRELDVVYNSYLSHQYDTAKLNAINKLQIQIEKKYSNYRAEVNGKKLFR